MPLSTPEPPGPRPWVIFPTLGALLLLEQPDTGRANEVVVVTLEDGGWGCFKANWANELLFKILYLPFDVVESFRVDLGFTF